MPSQIIQDKALTVESFTDAGLRVLGPGLKDQRLAPPPAGTVQ